LNLRNCKSRRNPRCGVTVHAQRNFGGNSERRIFFFFLRGSPCPHIRRRARSSKRPELESCSGDWRGVPNLLSAVVEHYPLAKTSGQDERICGIELNVQRFQQLATALPSGSLAADFTSATSQTDVTSIGIW